MALGWTVNGVKRNAQERGNSIAEVRVTRTSVLTENQLKQQLVQQFN